MVNHMCHPSSLCLANNFLLSASVRILPSCYLFLLCSVLFMNSYSYSPFNPSCTSRSSSACSLLIQFLLQILSFLSTCLFPTCCLLHLSHGLCCSPLDALGACLSPLNDFAKGCLIHPQLCSGLFCHGHWHKLFTSPCWLLQVEKSSNGKGGTCIRVQVCCLSALPDRQPYCHKNATFHSLLKDDNCARDNCLRSVRHRIGI